MDLRDAALAKASAFRSVPYMGVIFVVAEAVKLGFSNGHPDWCNLGQGQPEVGEIDGAPPRIRTVSIAPEDHAYGPLEGTAELRAAVAAHYNRLYRRGKSSQYTARNVAIAQGGRLALTRAMAALGQVRVGYQRPDYTAYEDMFALHLSRVTPVGVLAKKRDGFALTPEVFEATIAERELDAFVLSNPCNPTGVALEGEDLARIVATACGRTSGSSASDVLNGSSGGEGARSTALLLDEFYSHFAYLRPASGKGDATPADGPISGAAFVEDVDRDPIVLCDGLTKSYRYPGWRLGWVVGPPEIVETMARTASSIDGGPSRIVQRAALEALEPARADQETDALRRVFCAKRNVMVRRLKEMGLVFAAEPNSTFYCWASIAGLRPPFDDAEVFFRRALERKVMTVPGEFFDIDPGKKRRAASPFRQWMRFSFGPPQANMELGLNRLAEMLG